MSLRSLYQNRPIRADFVITTAYLGCKVQLHVLVVHPGQRPKVGDRQSGRSTGGSLIFQGRYGNCEGLTGILKPGGKRSSGEATKPTAWIHWVTETETMGNFAGSLSQVEIEQGSLTPNYDRTVRTRMKRSPRMKLFSPKLRTWFRQWNVQTLYEPGKLAQLAAEMRRYRLEILGISEVRWINKCLRMILNIRWPEVISNEQLWGRAHQSRIHENIKRRKWKWIGHTLRKPENSITRSALEWNPQGFRRKGRPSNAGGGVC